MPDVLRFWDTLLADRLSARLRGKQEEEGIPRDILMSHGYESLGHVEESDVTRRGQFLTDFLLGRMQIVRKQIIKLDFDEALLLLQEHPVSFFDDILKEGYKFARISSTVTPTDLQNGTSVEPIKWMNVLKSMRGGRRRSSHRSTRSLTSWIRPEKSTELVVLKDAPMSKSHCNSPTSPQGFHTRSNSLGSMTLALERLMSHVKPSVNNDES
jgi:hypothetical protein